MEKKFCPICNVIELEKDDSLNAVSRYDLDLSICEGCARDEAMAEIIGFRVVVK